MYLNLTVGDFKFQVQLASDDDMIKGFLVQLPFIDAWGISIQDVLDTLRMQAEAYMQQ